MHFIFSASLQYIFPGLTRCYALRYQNGQSNETQLDSRGLFSFLQHVWKCLVSEHAEQRCVVSSGTITFPNLIRTACTFLCLNDDNSIDMFFCFCCHNNCTSYWKNIITTASIIQAVSALIPMQSSNVEIKSTCHHFCCIDFIICLCVL